LVPLLIARIGRPTRNEAAALAARVVAAATTHFLHDGYGRTSMEAVARSARVSKRTLYKHHPDKPALLRAVVVSLVGAWREPFDAEPDDPADLEGSLTRLGRRMLDVALTPEALALHRLTIAEAGRFPEIVQALHSAGTITAIDRIAMLLEPVVPADEARWAAEQFQRLILAGPQSRALGFGVPLDEAGRESWTRRSVRLFLGGIDQALVSAKAA
jgi:AcrR family transcriptional regulator